jgi:hypothetical protein
MLRKKKSLASGERAEREASIERQAQAATAAAKASTSSRRTETPDVGSGGEGSKKTAAEEKFDRIQDERVGPIHLSRCRTAFLIVGCDHRGGNAHVRMHTRLTKIVWPTSTLHWIA